MGFAGCHDPNLLKEHLMEECNLHTIVRLPNSVFKPLRQYRHQAIIKNPHVVDLFGGNVAKVAEDSFVNALSGKDLVFRETPIAKLATLRGQLNGPNPSPLEKLLVERVVACWLQVQDADIRFAQAKAPPSRRRTSTFDA